MPKDSLLVKNVTFIIVVRRIKILGIAITVGLMAIYGMGLIVAGNNVKENFEIVLYLAKQPEEEKAAKTSVPGSGKGFPVKKLGAK